MCDDERVRCLLCSQARAWLRRKLSYWLQPLLEYKPPAGRLGHHREMQMTDVSSDTYSDGGCASRQC
jgi:hypothetical protein